MKCKETVTAWLNNPGGDDDRYKTLCIYMDASRVNQREMMNIHLMVGDTYISGPHQTLPDYMGMQHSDRAIDNLSAAMSGEKGKSSAAPGLSTKICLLAMLHAMYLMMPTPLLGIFKPSCIPLPWHPNIRKVHQTPSWAMNYCTS